MWSPCIGCKNVFIDTTKNNAIESSTIKSFLIWFRKWNSALESVWGRSRKWRVLVALGSGVHVHQDGQGRASGFYSSAAAQQISLHTQWRCDTPQWQEPCCFVMAGGLSLLFGREHWSPGSESPIPAELCWDDMGTTRIRKNNKNWKEGRDCSTLFPVPGQREWRN